MRTLVRLLVIASVLTACGAPAFAQLPGDGPRPAGQRAGRRGLPPSAPPASDALNNEQVFALLDSFVLNNAQRVLQLNDSQWPAFFQRMMRLQNLQRRHRRARQRLLAELRQLIGPRAQQAGIDEASVTAKTKELDDLDLKIQVDEQKALSDIDDVLQVRQRAHLRVFLENMERQKLELLIRARQAGRNNAPATSPPPAAGRGQ